MGRDQGAASVTAALIGLEKRPAFVVDADALFHLRRGTGDALWGRLRREDILTPHPGEAARLLGWSTKEVQADRPAALRALTDQSPAAVVLKGAGTLVARRGDIPALAPFAAPGLAVGGSGDVLGGVCATFLSKGYNSFMAAALGVYLHGKAGELLSAESPYQGCLAREIANALPKVTW
jgi:NAD(P)H-hydrate epimerase